MTPNVSQCNYEVVVILACSMQHGVKFQHNEVATNISVHTEPEWYIILACCSLSLSITNDDFFSHVGIIGVEKAK